MLNRAFDTSRAFVGGEVADKSPVDKLHRLQILQKIFTRKKEFKLKVRTFLVSLILITVISLKTFFGVL